MSSMALLRVAALVSALALVAVATFVPHLSNDFWLQARIGQLILDTGNIPHTVLFPFTEVRDNRFNAHEWVPSIAFHLLERFLGEDYLVFVLGAFGLALFALSVGLVWRVTHSLGASLLLALGAIAVANYRHLLRPELFALVLLLLLLHVFVSYQQSRRCRHLLWTVPIAVVWANSHGSFLLGPVLAMLFAVGEALQCAVEAPADRSWKERLLPSALAARPYVLTAIAMVVGSLCNPLGPALFHFALTLSTSDVTKAFINEWNATLAEPFVSSRRFVIFALALTGAAALVVWRRDHVRWSDLFVMTAFAALALQRQRFVVLFGFAALLPCARAIGLRPAPAVERRLLMAATSLSAVGLALALQFGNAYSAYPYFASTNAFTEPMLARLQSPSTRGNVINSYELGGELIYRAWPRLKPSLDSRIDSYGDRYFLAMQELMIYEDRLRSFVDHYDVRYMLLLWRDFESIKPMGKLQADGWRMEFSDHKAVLLSRQPAAASAAVP